MFNLNISWNIEHYNEHSQTLRYEPASMAFNAISYEEAMLHINNFPKLFPSVQEYYFMLKRK